MTRPAIVIDKNQSRSRGIAAVATAAGLVAAVVELAAILTIQGLLLHVPPTPILQAIASGLIGAAAFAGGLPTAALGVALHTLISLAAALIYVAAARRQT